ncbi:MAG: hypothetical protein K2L03_07425, partial [Bacteroidales bacterium]|nr:hypothetical protein [Bacteroidales bacterium]
MKKLTWALLSLMLFLGLGVAFAQGEMPGFGVGGGDFEVTVPTLNPASGKVEPGATINATFSNDFCLGFMTSEAAKGMAFVLYVENDATTQLETTAEILQKELMKYMGGEDEDLMAVAEGDEEETLPYRIAVYGVDPLAEDPDDPEDYAGYMKWYAPITISEDADGDVKLRAKVAVMTMTVTPNGDDEEPTVEYGVQYSDEFTAAYTTIPVANFATPLEVKQGEGLNITLPEDLDLANYLDGAFILYVANDDETDLTFD